MIFFWFVVVLDVWVWLCVLDLEVGAYLRKKARGW